MTEQLPFRSRLKVKVGSHEFEAEGEPGAVQAQYEAFLKMIGNPSARRDADGQEQQVAAKDKTASMPNGNLMLENILKVDGRIVSMTTAAKTVHDAILIIMLGQKNLRANDLVTGAELTDGLRTSGHQVSRVDYIMEKLVDDGHVIKIGAHRSIKYRLTNPGLNRATELAKELISVVA
jgi:hypothetical protein